MRRGHRRGRRSSRCVLFARGAASAATPTAARRRRASIGVQLDRLTGDDDRRPSRRRVGDRRSAPRRRSSTRCPVVVLIVLLALTIALFGTDATGGPLQVALLTSAAFAALVAFKNGHTVGRVRDAAVGGISSALGAVFILLAVGALIGTWNMAGTIPTVVYYGVGLLSATWFYPATAIICGLVGLAIGSSWTTAGTLGVAFVALAPLLGVDPVDHGRGGDLGRLLRRQDDADLRDDRPGAVDGRRRHDAAAHRGDDLDVRAGGGHRLVALRDPRPDDADAGTRRSTRRPPRRRSANEFWISPLNLLPLVLLIVLSVRRVPPFLSIFGCALFAGVLAWFTQPDAVAAFVDRPEPGPLATTSRRIYAAMANGFVSNTGNATIDALFSRGGMAGMLTTIWLVLGASQLRRGHGGRRLPRAAHPARRRPRPVDRPPDRRRSSRPASA